MEHSFTTPHGLLIYYTHMDYKHMRHSFYYIFATHLYHLFTTYTRTVDTCANYILHIYYTQTVTHNKRVQGRHYTFSLSCAQVCSKNTVVVVNTVVAVNSSRNVCSKIGAVKCQRTAKGTRCSLVSGVRSSLFSLVN